MNGAKTFDQNDVNTNKGLAIVMAIIPILFFLPLVMDDKKSSLLLKHTANQSLLLLIAAIGYSVVGWIILFIPVLGKLVYGLLYLALIVLFIINIINTAQANGKPFPFVGSIEILK